MKKKFAGAGFTALTLLLMPLRSDVDPGKAIYKDSCQHCHGPEGTGDQRADRLYKVRIPRLNSAAIQQYTDAQIKGIVMGGKGKMKPVRLGAPSDPHGKKLTGDQVNLVVAYVRTLKK